MQTKKNIILERQKKLENHESYELIPYESMK